MWTVSFWKLYRTRCSFDQGHGRCLLWCLIWVLKRGWRLYAPRNLEPNFHRLWLANSSSASWVHEFWIQSTHFKNVLPCRIFLDATDLSDAAGGNWLNFPIINHHNYSGLLLPCNQSNSLKDRPKPFWLNKSNSVAGSREILNRRKSPQYVWAITAVKRERSCKVWQSLAHLLLKKHGQKVRNMDRLRNKNYLHKCSLCQCWVGKKSNGFIFWQGRVQLLANWKRLPERLAAYPSHLRTGQTNCGQE